MILADLRNLKDNDGALDTTARDAAETLELIKNVAASLRKSKRCVVVTGAGISVAAGIPDFRSKDGLFSQIKERYPSTVVTGQDLFDARLFKDPASIPIFYSFMGELKDLVAKATPTRSHHFLKMLDQRSQLLRCYTQNIDCLESSLHLSSDLTLDKRARIVQLHGDLKNVVCTMCARLFAFSEAWNDKYFKFGTAPPCPRCSDADQVRTALGKRNLPVGTLRPNVVLYNEHHPKGDQIADAASFDMKRKPDFLIVMGTSLKVFGIKRLVKDLARCIRDSYSTTPMNPLSSESDPANHPSKRSAVFGDNKRPRIILINQTELAAHSEWDDVFDVHIRADSDDAVKLIEMEVARLDEVASVRASQKGRKSVSATALPSVGSKTGSVELEAKLRMEKAGSSSQRKSMPEVVSSPMPATPTKPSPHSAERIQIVVPNLQRTVSAAECSDWKHGATKGGRSVASRTTGPKQERANGTVKISDIFKMKKKVVSTTSSSTKTLHAPPKKCDDEPPQIVDANDDIRSAEFPRSWKQLANQENATPRTPTSAARTRACAADTTSRRNSSKIPSPSPEHAFADHLNPSVTPSNQSNGRNIIGYSQALSRYPSRTTPTSTTPQTTRPSSSLSMSTSRSASTHPVQTPRSIETITLEPINVTQEFETTSSTPPSCGLDAEAWDSSNVLAWISNTSATNNFDDDDYEVDLNVADVSISSSCSTASSTKRRPSASSSIATNKAPKTQTKRRKVNVASKHCNVDSPKKSVPSPTPVPKVVANTQCGVVVEGGRMVRGAARNAALAIAKDAEVGRRKGRKPIAGGQ